MRETASDAKLNFDPTPAEKTGQAFVSKDGFAGWDVHSDKVLMSEDLPQAGENDLRKAATRMLLDTDVPTSAERLGGGGTAKDLEVQLTSAKKYAVDSIRKSDQPETRPMADLIGKLEGFLSKFESRENSFAKNPYRNTDFLASGIGHGYAKALENKIDYKSIGVASIEDNIRKNQFVLNSWEMPKQRS